MNRKSTVVLAAVVMLGWVPSAMAQGFLVVREQPRIYGVYEVAFHHVNMQVENQICKVQQVQAFRNPSSVTLEVEYFFPLPEDAAIDNFVMMVDGKEMPGRLLDRDEARRIYEGIVRQKKDPALMEYMGRGLFKTSVFPIPAGKQREIHISFTRLAKRDGNVIELGYPLGTEKYSTKALGELKLKCRITSKHAIKSVYSSTHDVQITRPNEKVAEVTLLQRDVLPRHDFGLVYSVSDDDVGLSVLSYRPDKSKAGYFLLLASPKVEVASDEVLAKSVIFVLDKSGSMTGPKIEQAKNALNFVLKNLRAGDTFNIVTYDHEVNSFAPELQKVDSDTLVKAREFVQRISAGGSTNIDGALRTSMEMLKSPTTPAYIIFLTDGLPTAGEQREPAIVDHCSTANQVRARLMAFGVGDDVNARLLDKLVASNFGNSHYVRPNQDIEGPVSRLYGKLSAPVLSYLEMDFPSSDASLTYPKVLPDLFVGSQLVLVGRYHQPGTVAVHLKGKVGEREQSFAESVTLDDHQAPYARSFVEKLWAERRVGYLIDEIDLHGKNQELVDEIVALSIRYGILTPYTSFLADEDVMFRDAPQISLDAGDEFEVFSFSTSGADAVRQRVLKRGRMEANRPGGSISGGNGGRGGGGGSGGMRFAPCMGGGGGGSGAGSYQMGQTLSGEVYEVQTVLNVGQKTFFKKEGRWVDSTVSEEQEKQAIKLVRYSDAYFELVSRLPANVNQYFTIDGELLINLEGKTYWIVPEVDEESEEVDG